MKIYRYAVFSGILSLLVVAAGCGSPQEEKKADPSEKGLESGLSPKPNPNINLDGNTVDLEKVEVDQSVSPILDFPRPSGKNIFAELRVLEKEDFGYEVEIFIDVDDINPDLKIFRRIGQKETEIPIEIQKPNYRVARDTNINGGERIHYLLKEGDQILKLWDVNVPKDLFLTGSYVFPSLPCGSPYKKDHHYCIGYRRIFLDRAYLLIGSETLVLSAQKIISIGSRIESVPLGVHTAPRTEAPRAGSIQISALEAKGWISLSARGVGGAHSDGIGGRGGDAGSIKISIQDANKVTVLADCPGGAGGNPQHPDPSLRGGNGWGCGIQVDLNGIESSASEYFQWQRPLYGKGKEQ